MVEIKSDGGTKKQKKKPENEKKTCPYCGRCFKAKRLRRHIDSQHSRALADA